MAYTSVTYTFTNATTADASQVNQNFTDLINGLSDGTKDLNIAAIVAAGNATFNGNVTLGNASSDDLTVTASLASAITIKTTNTYDVGTAAACVKDIYCYKLLTDTIDDRGTGGITCTPLFISSAGIRVDGGTAAAKTIVYASSAISIHDSFTIADTTGLCTIGKAAGAAHLIYIPDSAQGLTVRKSGGTFGQGLQISVYTNEVRLNATGDASGSMAFYSGATNCGGYASTGAWTLGNSGAVTASRHDHYIYHSGNTGSCALITGPSTALGNNEYYQIIARSNVSGVNVALVGMIKIASLTYPQPYFYAGEIGTQDNYVWGASGKLYISSTITNVGTTTGTVVGDQTSDERLKQIDPIYPYGIAEVMKLKPIAFEINGERRIGFGAQTTRNVIPELVYSSGNVIKEGEELGLVMRNGNDITSVLVKAIQEQQAQIEELKKQLEK